MQSLFKAGKRWEPPLWKIAVDYFISGIFLALFIYLMNYLLNYRGANPLAASSIALYFILFLLVLLFWFVFRLGLHAILQGISFLRPVFFIVIFIAVALLLVTGLRSPAGRPVPQAGKSSPGGPLPNVLFLVVDTLRADHLSGYGYERPTSKTVDALIQDSILFERCIAQSSWTRPSTASIMTGLYPGTHLCNRMLSTMH
jgi:glucan phosphoethanolaminetransferase (alkaline phosphatase superfamily)